MGTGLPIAIAILVFVFIIANLYWWIKSLSDRVKTRKEFAEHAVEIEGIVEENTFPRFPDYISVYLRPSEMVIKYTAPSGEQAFYRIYRNDYFNHLKNVPSDLLIKEYKKGDKIRLLYKDGNVLPIDERDENLLTVAIGIPVVFGIFLGVFIIIIVFFTLN